MRVEGYQPDKLQPFDERVDLQTALAQHDASLPFRGLICLCCALGLIHRYLATRVRETGDAFYRTKSKAFDLALCVCDKNGQNLSLIRLMLRFMLQLMLWSSPLLYVYGKSTVFGHLRDVHETSSAIVTHNQTVIAISNRAHAAQRQT